MSDDEVEYIPVSKIKIEKEIFSKKKFKLSENFAVEIIEEELVDHVAIFKSKFTPSYLKENLIPKIETLIKNSDGKYKDFKIWPEYLST